RSTYKSGSRSVMIKPPLDGKGSFGAAAYSLPALYKGKTIELKGYIKLKDVADGFAGLFMRIDGDDGVLEFDNMQKQNLTGTADWKEYTIKLLLPENAKKIYVGTLLTGNGTLWADDFTVLVDGKKIEKLTPLPIVQYPADKDREFDNGS